MEFFFRAASTYDCGWTVRAADNADTSHIVSCLRCIAVRAWRNFQRLVPLSTITDRNIAVRFRRKRIAHGGKMRRIKPAVRAETLFGNCLPLQFLYGQCVFFSTDRMEKRNNLAYPSKRFPPSARLSKICHFLLRH